MSKTVTISIIGKASDAIRAFRETGNAAEKMDRKVKSSSNSTSVFGLVSKIAASKMVLFSAGIFAAIPAVTSLASALAPLAGGLLALPAAGLAALSVFGALKVATLGVGSAISDAFSGKAQQKIDTAAASLSNAQIAVAKTTHALNAAKASKTPKDLTSAYAAQATALNNLSKAQSNYNNAQSQLPPAAQSFVKDLLSLKPQLKTLQASVSAGLFTPLLGQIKPLAAIYLPLIQKRFTQITFAVGTFVARIAKAAQGTDFVRNFDNALIATVISFQRLTRYAPQLTKAVGSLLSLGGHSMIRAATGLGNLTGKLAAFVNSTSGQTKLKNWLDGSLDTLTKLGRIARNVGSGLFSIFKSMNTDGKGLLTTIGDITGDMAAFLKSTTGQKDMRTFFANLKASGTTVMDVLRQLLPIVGQYVVALSPATSQLLAIAGVLALQLAPALRWVADLLTKYPALAGAFVGALAGVAVINQFAKLRGAIIGITTSLEVLSGPVGWIILGLTALTAGVIYSYNHFDAFRRIVDRTRDAVVNAFNWLINLTWSDIGNAIIGGVTNPVHNAISDVEGLLSRVPGLLKKGASWAGNSLLPPTRSTPSSQALSPGGSNTTNIHVTASPTSDLASIGHTIVGAIKAHEQRSGRKVTVG